MKWPLCAQVALLTVIAVSGCRIEGQKTPSLTGPSEFGTSIGISITPDVLTQDGASQSVVTISARDANGAPMRNVSLRVEIEVAGVRADFGALSARNLVTGSDGRATVVYTAPAGPRVGVDNGTIVNIAITPVGTDFNNSSSRTASIRLVPPGVVVPPDGLRPAFTFSPPTPTDNQTVLFDASTSTSASGNPITSYAWNFGDGDRASGITTGHDFETAGAYVVTLTISDGFGRTASISQSVAIAGGLPPVAAFTSSPSEAAVGQQVNFNGGASTVPSGRTIESYDWDFGDGTFGTGRTVSHAYNRAGTYRPVLTVTDDSGKTDTSEAGSVVIK